MIYFLSITRTAEGISASVVPESLWHAPEGQEYVVQLYSDGKGWEFAYSSQEILSKVVAVQRAQQLWNANKTQATRVARVSRWTGRDNTVLIHSVTRFWGVLS